MALRLIFMGTPDFAVPVLQAFREAGDEILCAYTQPPRPANRGQKLQPSPVQRAAEEAGIPVRHPTSLKSPEAQVEFAALQADAAIVVAYGLLLPPAILAATKFGCFNLHASLLPRWRGAAPIQRAIMAGDAETGVCAMQMEAGLDTGPVLACEKLPITPGMGITELHDKLAGIGAPLMVRAVHDFAAGRITPEPQPSEGVTYAAKIQREEGRLDWHKSATDLDRTIRALNPGVSTWFEREGERIKVLKAEPVAGNGAPGIVLDDAATIACQDGALRLLMLQRPGKGPVPVADFLRGYALPKGTRLS